MITEEEIKDIQLLLDQDANTVSEFCQLSMHALGSSSSAKIYVSAANKLGINPIEVESTVHAILSILIKAAERGLTSEEFENELSTVGLQEASMGAILNSYEENKGLLCESLQRMAIKIPEYKELDWRFDLISRTRALNNVEEPIVAMQLKLKDVDNDQNQVMQLQADPNNLAHISACLEDALHQAHSHHLKKLKQMNK